MGCVVQTSQFLRRYGNIDGHKHAHGVCHSSNQTGSLDFLYSNAFVLRMTVGHFRLNIELLQGPDLTNNICRMTEEI